MYSGVALATNDEITKTITIYGNTPQMWDYRPLYSAGSMQGYAVITKSKIFEFEEGLNTVEISNFPVRVDPSSVTVKNLSVGKSIIEQEFKSSVFNLGAVLEETIGEEIEVEQLAGDRTIYHRGTLISASPNLVLKEDDRLRVLDGYASIIIANRDKTPGSNSVKWMVSSDQDSDDIIEYSFKTEGISWSAGYNLYIDSRADRDLAKFESWANIFNNTNLSAIGTELKLVAGKVGQVNTPTKAYMARAAAPMAMDSAIAEAATQFNEEKFSDYHMYRLPRQIDIEPYSSKKIKLYDDKTNVKIVKQYEYEPNKGNDIKSVIKIFNNMDSNMAIPLPAGKVEVFEKDSSGNFEKAGEAKISHTPVDEEIEFEIGKAFDITANKKKIDNFRDNARRYGNYTVRIEIKNAKSEDINVNVKEGIFNQNWKISRSSHKYQKSSANQVEFSVPVKAGGTQMLEYIVDYSW